MYLMRCTEMYRDVQRVMRNTEINIFLINNNTKNNFCNKIITINLEVFSKFESYLKIIN